jgi:hypothetical protein
MLKPVLAFSVMVCGSAFAADQGAANAARQNYQQERAACLKLAGDERKTCLREAGAALQEARKGTLATGGEFEQNAFIRCEVHKIALDRTLCERRMRGEGTVTGSVEGGGILRELTVTVPAEETSFGSDSFSAGQSGSGPGASDTKQ